MTSTYPDISFYFDDAPDDDPRTETERTLDQAKASGIKEYDPERTVLVTSEKQLEQLLSRIKFAPSVAFDLETTGLDDHAMYGGTSNGGVPAEIVCAAFTTDFLGVPGHLTNWVVPLAHPESPWLGQWREIATRLAEGIRTAHRKHVVGHHVKFDLRWMHAITGVDLSHKLLWDTQVSAHLLDENERTSLKDRASETFGVPRWDDFDLSKPGAAQRVPLVDLAAYAARDTYWTWRLFCEHYEVMTYDMEDYKHSEPSPPVGKVTPEREPTPVMQDEDIEFDRLGRLMRYLVVPTTRALTCMEQRGISLDLEWVDAEERKLTQLRDATYNALVKRYDLSGHPDGEAPPSFAPTSKWFRAWTEQAVNNDDLRVDALTNSGVPQWSASVLKRQAREGREVAIGLLAMRGAVKKLEYLASWRDLRAPDGRIYPTYRLGHVVTGRLSSARPNFQQVTRELKPAFRAGDGKYLAEIDYSQIELRVAALISGCEPMLEAFRNGEDLHTLLAAKLTDKPMDMVTKPERQKGKACIAEGELVATDHGLVPIEDVTVDMKVWDGVEWVTHDGVVDQGERFVITYDGLTATPDHKVFLATGETVDFATADYWRLPLRRGRAPQFSVVSDDSRTMDKSEQTATNAGGMPNVREDFGKADARSLSREMPGVLVQGQSNDVGQDGGRPQPAEAHASLSQHPTTDDTGDEGLSAEPSPEQTKRLHVGEPFLPSGDPSSSPQGLHGRDGREAGRLETVGAVQHPVNVQIPEPETEQRPHVDGGISGTRDASNARVARDETSTPHVQPGETPDDGQTQDALHGGGTTSGISRDRARTFDILNAGPRHRFTVSGKLVHNCIAHDEPVLTDSGEVPIQDVTTDHKVWDGVEWVPHEGIVSRGVRDVMTYDGLTATPDHHVYMSDGTMVCLGYAEATGERIASTATDMATELPVNFRGEFHHWETPGSDGRMRFMRHGVDQICDEHQTTCGPRLFVPETCEIPRPESAHVGGPVRCDDPTVQTGEVDVKELWGPGHTVALPGPGALHNVGARELATQVVQGCGHRQDQQRRGLRAGEFTAGHANGEPNEQKAKSFCRVHGYAGCPGSFVALDEDRSSRLPVFKDHYGKLLSGGLNPGGNASSEKEARRRERTYDLSEARPRHRFTVSGKLVAQCNFGLLYGMSPFGFLNYAETAYGVHMTEEEAAKTHAMYFETWEGLKQWHSRAISEVTATGQVVSPIGRIRRLPGIHGHDPGKAQRAAINSPVQGFASDVMQLAASIISGTVAGFQPVPGATIVGTVHDSILVELDADTWEQSLAACRYAMEHTVVEVMRERLGYDISVPLVADATVGTRWGVDDVLSE